MKITVVGSANTDMVIKVPKLPKSGETMLGGEFFMLQGGKGANQALSAARAGSKVTFVARVGNDMFGEKVIENFKEEGIETKYIIKDKVTPTGVAEIFVGEKGDSSICVAAGANANLSTYDIINAKQDIITSDIVLIQLEIPLKTVLYTAQLAKENNVKVILNPAPALPLPLELMKSIFLLTPNQYEAELLTGVKVTDEDSAEDAGRILLSKGAGKVIITLGEKGALVSDSSGSELVQGFKIDAVDTTAAGDIFNGALAVAIVENKNIYDAVKFANAAAALSVTKIGAQISAPIRDDILKFMKEAHI